MCSAARKNLPRSLGWAGWFRGFGQLLAQVGSVLAQVGFFLHDLRRESAFCDLQWRRSAARNRTCAICYQTCVTTTFPPSSQRAPKAVRCDLLIINQSNTSISWLALGRRPTHRDVLFVWGRHGLNGSGPYSHVDSYPGA